jgi:hypothetical protein
MTYFFLFIDALSGRALFTFDPTLFRDDDDADEVKYSVHSDQEKDDDEYEAKMSASVDTAAAVMDKSLYLEDAEEEDLDIIKE